ncbi:MAG: histidine kinase [Hansschlegelia sp.]
MTFGLAPDLPRPFERARVATRSLGGASLRVRILVLFVSVNFACACAAGVVTILNARQATEVEIASSLDTAGRLARETVTRLERDVGRLKVVADLQAALPMVRHARIVVEDSSGAAIASREPNARHGADERERVPDWFARLIQPPPSSMAIPVMIAGETAGSVVVHGDPADEIAEVWDDMLSLLALFVVLNVMTVAIFALLLGRELAPLGALAEGMADLRLGRLDRRIETPKSRELSAIVERFNALGQALAAERAKNGRMSWRMVSLQDDERRQIAKELHDELGPCLFGLRANLESLERAIASNPVEARGEAKERLATVADLSVRLSDMNRRLLTRLRPMALGAAPLPDVLAGLLADFQRQHPECHFELSASGIVHGYGEPVDLTVYRAVQEGVTNAVRHAACSRVAVTVAHGRDEGGAEALRVRVLDDGGGVADPAPAGFGLVGLGERLRALGGSFHLHNAPGGAALDVVVPLTHATDGAKATMKDFLQ